MRTKGNYVALYSGGYAIHDTLYLRGLSKEAMRYWIAKDIKGSGYDTTKDAAGHYICRYAREREQVLWAKWEFAQMPTEEQLKIIQADFKPHTYPSRRLHNQRRNRMQIKEMQESIQKHKGFMKLHKYDPRRVGKGWWVQRKYDGVFVAAKQCKGRWEFFSRTGKPLYIEDTVHDSLCEALPKYDTDLMLVGELVCTGCSLEQLSGLVNPNRTTAWSEDDTQTLRSAASIVWHDSLRLVDGQDTMPYLERYKRLSLHVPYSIENIHITDGCLDAVFQHVTQEQGWEGLVLKDPNAPYVMGKRSYAQLKRVRQYTEDLECVGVLMGQGKRTGMIGALVFRSLDGSTTFNADLGAGWANEKRKVLTEQWQCGELQHVLGLWEVQGLQPSSTGRAIRLPKAIRRRYDKD